MSSGKDGSPELKFNIETFPGRKSKFYRDGHRRGTQILTCKVILLGRFKIKDHVRLDDYLLEQTTNSARPKKSGM